MKFIIRVVVSLIKGLITGILTPINTLIIDNIPGLQTATTAVYNMLDWLKDFIDWVFSWLPFTSDMMNFLILSLLFLISIPVITDLIKLVVKWWHALAP